MTKKQTSLWDSLDRVGKMIGLLTALATFCGGIFQFFALTAKLDHLSSESDSNKRVLTEINAVVTRLDQKAQDQSDQLSKLTDHILSQK